MLKHTILVYKSYHHSSEERSKNLPFDGNILLDQLNTLCAEQFPGNEIEINQWNVYMLASRPCYIRRQTK